MKIKIKSYNGELPDYLTLDKEYEVLEYYEDVDSFYIVDDQEDEIYTLRTSTHHLNGGEWEIVEWTLKK